MAKFFRNLMIAVPALGMITPAMLLTSNQAYTSTITSDRLNTSVIEDVSHLQPNNQSPQQVDLLAQVNSIEEIPDVSPDDYYYNDLREIVESLKLDIILPDGTFRGNEFATRGQFVQWLSDSLELVEELILFSEGDPSFMVDDLEQIANVIVEENLAFELAFAEELAQIKVRLEALEGRVNTKTVKLINTLEKVNQTTKITSVEQISDVSSTDPYFKALKTLINHYQMNVTLPDGSFRGNQPITRGDLVIYLRDTLDLIDVLITPRRIASVSFDEVETVEKLITSINDDNKVLLQRIEQIKTKLDDLEGKITQSDYSLLVKEGRRQNPPLTPLRRGTGGSPDESRFFPVPYSLLPITYLQVRKEENLYNSIRDIPDVSSDEPYYDALRKIVEEYRLDLTLPDGTFKGNQPITRGEVIIYLNDTIAILNDIATFYENPELELRLDKLLSQAADAYFDFIARLTKIKQIEAQLNELESQIERNEFRI